MSDLPPFCDEMRMYMEALKVKILGLNAKDARSLWEAYRMVGDSMTKVENGYSESIAATELLQANTEDPKPFSLSDAVQLLKNEVAWCYANPDDDLSEEYQKGFVTGIAQVALLLQSGVEASGGDASNSEVDAFLFWTACARAHEILDHVEDISAARAEAMRVLYSAIEHAAIRDANQ